MRNLITDYSFEPNTRTITLDKFANLSENNPFSVENIRLIVNETQKVVICSSMQKDNVTVEGNTITYTDSLAPLAFGDQLTIEVDMGDGITYVDSGDWVIQAKLDILRPIEKQEPWVLDYAKGAQLAQLAENGVRMPALFYGTNIIEADLSSWTKINGNNICSSMFAECPRLTRVNLSGVHTITGNQPTLDMFNNSNALNEVDLTNVVEMTDAVRMFANCRSLQRVIAPNLAKLLGNSEGLFSACQVLRNLELPNLSQIVVSRQMFANGCNIERLYVPQLRFLGTGSLDTQNTGGGKIKELHIHVDVVRYNTTYSFISQMTALTDLYLYGDATNSIYLSWQGSLNFNSVCGVLRKLCENTDASGLVCAFRSNFPAVQDVKSYTYIDGDGVETPYTNETGVLKALYDEAVGNGWNIQNLKINPVE